MLGQQRELAAIDRFGADYVDHCVFGAVQQGVRDWDPWIGVSRCIDRQLLSPESGIRVEHCEAIGTGSHLCDFSDLATLCALQLDEHLRKGYARAL
jgi:hypothetical protein